jgi:hypothetical protein
MQAGLSSLIPYTVASGHCLYKFALYESVYIRLSFAPNRFASLGVIHIENLRFSFFSFPDRQTGTSYGLLHLFYLLLSFVVNLPLSGSGKDNRLKT